MFRGTKSELIARTSPEADNCIRFIGTRRYEASISASNKLIVATGLIDDTFLAWSRPRDEHWVLVLEDGVIPDERGVWIERNTVKPYFESGIEVVIDGAGAPERAVTQPRPRLAGELTPISYSTGGSPGSPVVSFLDTCFQKDPVLSTKHGRPVLIAHTTACAIAPLSTLNR
jgi:hypothetical protein